MTIDLDNLTIGQLKEINNLMNTESSKSNTDATLNYHLGQRVIIRTYSAGVWYGKLVEKAGKEVILENARRMYYFQCEKSISLSGVAVHGIDASKSKICPRLNKVWLEAIEILELSEQAIKTLEDAPDVEAQ